MPLPSTPCRRQPFSSAPKLSHRPLAAVPEVRSAVTWRRRWPRSVRGFFLPATHKLPAAAQRPSAQVPEDHTAGVHFQETIHLTCLLQPLRVLVEMEARRQAEQCMNTMQEQMQQMQEQINQMKELMIASQGGHNLETPSSQHGSNSRQNSRVEPEEDNDGEEDEDEGIYVHRRVVARPPPPKSSSTRQDESLLLLLRLQFSQSIKTLLWVGSPLGRRLMRMLSMLRLEGTLRFLINMMDYDMSAMLSEGLLHGHLAR